jgi:hypothetical protein
MTDYGPLTAFLGAYGGLASSGLSAIFRPNSATTPTKLPIPVTSNNVLQLSIIQESLRFINAPGLLGTTINRGGAAQADESLVQVDYVQYVEDINLQSAAGLSTGGAIIHQELGTWLLQPPTNDQPAAVQRLSVIPHGVALVAEGTFQTITGKPVIPPVSMQPFDASTGWPVPTTALRAASPNTARLPQDPATLAKYGITQAVLDDPNKLLRDKIAGQNITSTVVISVDTDNGDAPATTRFVRENAACPRMRSTFYIETVSGWFGPQTQIQYFQEVFLEFGGVTYPHVTVATLTKDPLPTPVIF